MAYIDRDKLNEAMYHEAFEKSSDFQKWDSGCWIRYKLFENVLKSIPTADVQEVKRGEWIWQGSISEGCWICSECNHKFYQGYGNENFCPNCGAKMDGKETKVEVVGEIVRCKDCIHSFKRELGYGCDLDYRLGTNGKWFCADGERKETDDAEIH